MKTAIDNISQLTLRGGSSMEILAIKKVDFVAEHWPVWEAHFLRFRSAADLANKAEICLFNTLIYSVGDHSEVIFNCFIYQKLA